jgi:2-hydroxycyclohexanecarboxyl-CoA dehydrogenase
MKGRVAVVTGAASGIGEGVARYLHALGAAVVLCDIDDERGRQVSSELDGTIFQRMDVTDSSSVDASILAASTTLGPIDVLVNCAGADVIKPFLETDEALWRWLVELNLMGVFRTTKAVLPGMVERGWGRVVNIASDAGRVGSSGEAVYSGAKGGVIAFTKTVAREISRKGVTANVVCPGPTDTPAVRKSLAEGGDDVDRLISSLTRSIPVGRLGVPSDIAAAVAFFASEEAGFITGQTLSVSGGLTMA